jgi:hypothetical protein
MKVILVGEFDILFKKLSGRYGQSYPDFKKDKDYKAKLAAYIRGETIKEILD